MTQNTTYKNYYLYPGGLFVSPAPTIVTTVLGSCVSLCLFDTVNKFGGINHFMLPLWNGKGLASPKYGNIAIPRLIEKMEELGSNRKNLKAKLFGGGDVLHSNISQFQIGRRNIELALELLEKEKIAIVSSSLGGELGRKIIFYTDTGNVMQKMIQKTECTIPVINPNNE